MNIKWPEFLRKRLLGHPKLYFLVYLLKLPVVILIVLLKSLKVFPLDFAKDINDPLTWIILFWFLGFLSISSQNYAFSRICGALFILSIIYYIYKDGRWKHEYRYGIEKKITRQSLNLYKNYIKEERIRD